MVRGRCGVCWGFFLYKGFVVMVVIVLDVGHGDGRCTVSSTSGVEATFLLSFFFVSFYGR